ncbi:hypothetical protein GCM10010206_70550 [Streptomyces cinerochromogenes]|nr:hypothetical protein GCM10010206_70550 [Streptomyces cinerochromogenes]
METVVRVIVGLKVAGLALFAVVLVTSIAYTIAVGPEEPESTHGSTAVCEDGTVFQPPWNVCGESHGYLDHWTTVPLLPSANHVFPPSHQRSLRSIQMRTTGSRPIPTVALLGHRLPLPGILATSAKHPYPPIGACVKWTSNPAPVAGGEVQQA